MQKKLLLIGALLLSGFSLAQKEKLWTIANSKKAETLPEKLKIKNQKIYHLELQSLIARLKAAPYKNTTQKKQGIIIQFPGIDNTIENYSVKESSNFDPELAAKYPDIKSYTGQSVNNPGDVVHFSISPLGLSYMKINKDKSSVFIEPYNKDLQLYTIYKKSDLKENLSKFECDIIESTQNNISTSSNKTVNADDGILRTFKLALSCTGEYGKEFDTAADALAAMNDTMTRVNAIFENDLGIKFILIPNSDLLVYTDPTTDPFTNPNNVQLMLNQNKANINQVIGEANYDIGHLFAISNVTGGAASFGQICNNDKARALTYGPLQGPYFDIAAAHEMGHQLGARHTYSFSPEGYASNVEPGAGSTIMGISHSKGSSQQSYQYDWDDYFHALSIDQIMNVVKANTCSVNIPTGNTAPTADAGKDYIIPIDTPFVLTGEGNDIDGDLLTYSWEQMDAADSTEGGINSLASPTKLTGPNFRSQKPSPSPIRYFPEMPTVLEGETITRELFQRSSEALSTIARDLNFRLTVRDNKTGGGARY